MILRNLPIGTKVREEKSSLVFIVADHHHTAYQGTALITDCVVKIASLDAAEPDNPDESMRELGNNFYPQSNIHQWLNSNEADWYKPSYDFDAPPVSENISLGRIDFYEAPFYSEEVKFLGDYSYKKDPGFLTWFPKEFVDNIYEVDIQCYIDPIPGKEYFGPPDSYSLKAKVFLLSAPEIGFEKLKNGVEGFRFPLFNDGRMRVAAPTYQAIGKPDTYVYDDCSLFYWLRTPFPGSHSKTMIYNSDHKLTDTNGMTVSPLAVKAVCGIRPVLNLVSSVTVTDKPDAEGIYTLLFGGV